MKKKSTKINHRKHYYSFSKLVITALLGVTTCLTNVMAQTPFVNQNLVVLQVGNGTRPLTGSSTNVSLEEFTPAGGFVNSHNVPITGANRLTLSGNGNSEGQITRSADYLKIVIAGYDADTGFQSVGTASSASAVNRVIGSFDAAGNYSRPVSSSAFFSGNAFRSAVSSCDDYWGVGAGSSSGVNYFGTGAAGNVSSTNARAMSCREKLSLKNLSCAFSAIVHL